MEQTINLAGIIYTWIHFIIHSLNTHWLSVILVLSWEVGIRHEQDLGTDTPSPAPTLEKVKGICFSAIQLRGVIAEQIQSQNRTEVPKLSVLVSTLRASRAQALLSPGDNTGPLFCWLTDIGFLRWKQHNTTWAVWVEQGNGWDFLLFCTSLFKSYWEQIRWPQSNARRPAGPTWNMFLFVGRLGLGRGRCMCGACFRLWHSKCLLWMNSQKKWTCPFTLVKG